MSREKILDAAVVQFAEHGFDGASTRDIAKAANTAMSSITYHFGGKEGLYLATADHIAAQIRGRLQSPASEPAIDLAVLTPDEARAHLLAIIDGFARLLLHPDSESWSQFIVREQQRPTEAFNRLYDGVMHDMTEVVVALIGIACPNMPMTERRTQTALLYGQALVLRVGRACVCRILESDSIAEVEEQILRDQLRKNALILLSENGCE